MLENDRIQKAYEQIVTESSKMNEAVGTLNKAINKFSMAMSKMDKELKSIFLNAIDKATTDSEMESIKSKIEMASGLLQPDTVMFIRKEFNKHE